jgi:predicted outer membrane repeat protein
VFAGTLGALLSAVPGAAAQATVERASGPNVPPVPRFTILVALGGALTVRRLNFRNGDGAINVEDPATLTVDGGVFSGNSTTNGGAIDVNAIEGPVISHAFFTGNTATDAGGAVYSNAADEGVRVTDCIFTGNTATVQGGAIFDYNASGTNVKGSTFYRNAAGSGGAISTSTDSGTDVSARPRSRRTGRRPAAASTTTWPGPSH